jgi:hypothetical protein
VSPAPAYAGLLAGVRAAYGAVQLLLPAWPVSACSALTQAGLSVAALALADPKWRRPALVSGLTATAFAVGGALAARRATPDERRTNHAGP